MNMKKIAILALSLCMIAAIAVTGTIAYFTDVETATNVFTLGDVIIDLVEEQRNPDPDNTSEPLVEFENNKLLMPIVGSAQGEKVNVGGYNLPTAENWVDKIVTVDNEGNQPAYVRTLMAFPAKLDDASAANMLLHWNSDGAEPDGYWTRKGGDVTITIDNEEYNIYTFTYEKVLEKKGKEGATTKYPAMTGVYMDARVDATTNEDSTVTYSMTLADGQTVKSVTYAQDNGPKLYVIAQGVQSAGFDSADAALTAGFGEVTKANAEKWFGDLGIDERADVE